ncbi:hypothetical protein HG530_009073 [Fusarium avenaceum]|nr:hypothetical protein HG530_009073 [Fusarium avenaceum]
MNISLGNFLLGGEDERSVLHYGLIERSTSDEGQTRGLGRTGVDLEVDNFTLRLEDNVVVLSDNTALVILTDDDIAFKRVGKGVPVRRQRLANLASGTDLDVEEPDRSVGEILHRVDAVALA